MKRPKTTGIQYAALPFRIEGRRLEVLLITSRETRRWVIPKGWPMEGLRPQDAAALEATEEAGVVGEIEDRPIGSYRYVKRLKGQKAIPIQVIVFPLAVQGLAEEWKEEGQRTHKWVSCRQAQSMVLEPHLKRLIREFCRERAPVHAPSRLVRWVGRLLTPPDRRLSPRR